MLFRSASSTASMALALACIEAVEDATLPHPDSPLAPHVTLSVGVASAVGAGAPSPAPLLDAADSAMYAAKRAGRRRAVMAE